MISKEEFFVLPVDAVKRMESLSYIDLIAKFAIGM